MVIFGAIGAGVLFIAGAIGVASMLMKGKDETADKPASSASAMAALSAAPSSSALAAASASAAPAATDSTAAVASAAPTDSSGPAAAPSATTTSTAKPATTAAAANTATPATTTAPAAATTAAAAATAAAVAPAAGGGADQPFNMGAAKASLGGIAGGAQELQEGRRQRLGPRHRHLRPQRRRAVGHGRGHGVRGRTPAGSCIARMFRGARVPPFSGSPFSVRKSFSVN